MAATNKTINYDLSQFIGTDKPTWLGDYNSDMQKIDEALHTNSESIESAQSTANNAQTTANNALSSGTSNTSDIQKLQSDFTTLSNMVLSNKTDLETSISNNTNLITQLNTSVNGFKGQFVTIDSVISMDSNGIGSVQIDYPTGFTTENCVPISKLYKGYIFTNWTDLTADMNTSSGTLPTTFAYLSNGGLTNPNPSKFAIQLEWGDSSLGKPAEGTQMSIRITLYKYKEN